MVKIVKYQRKNKVTKKNVMGYVELKCESVCVSVNLEVTKMD